MAAPAGRSCWYIKATPPRDAEPRRFTLVEHWADQAAVDAHRLAEAYTTIYKPQVMPLVDREGHPSTLLE